MGCKTNRHITDFLDNLSHASWKRQGRDAAKQKLVEYVLLSGYGNEYYNEQQMLRAFKELDAMGLLFSHNAGDKVLDSYVAFRENYHHF